MHNAGRPDALRLESVSLRFGSLQVLADVSVSVAAGSIHALIGPNGAGKSTLFNVVSGLYRCDAGRVEIDGVDVTGERPHRIAARGVARSFQNLVHTGGETVLDTLMLGRHRLLRSSLVSVALGLPGSRRESAVHERRAREIARFIGLDGVLDRQVSVLPYGDQKRVDIARALCMEPRLLLLDEPAAGLDAAESARMAQMIQSLRDQLGITIVLVEHDMGMVMAISDQVSVLDFGRLLSSGTPDEVQRDPAVATAYLGVG